MSGIKNYLNTLLARRHISMTALPAQLGYLNKTALNHVLSGKASHRSIDQFGERVIEKLSLSPDEEKELMLMLDLLKWKDDFYPIREMTQLIFSPKVSETEFLFEDSDHQSVDLFERYSDAADLNITLMNSQYVNVFPLLLRLIREKDARIRHYLLSDNDTPRTIRAIHAVLPIVNEPNYIGYVYPVLSDGGLHRPLGLLAADAMFIRYQSGDGSQHTDFVIFTTENRGVFLSMQDGSLISAPPASFSENCTPLKHRIPSGTAFEDYIHFIGNCSRLEYNREIYRIKSDVCMDFIPDDILIQAGLEGSAPTDDLMDEVLDLFRKILSARFTNTYEKQKTSHAIFRREAMRSFALTGKTTDHFWGLRPFTPSERIRILQLLLDQARNNPFFHIHFLKEGSFLYDAEITYYEGVGILITASDTHYSLEAGHSEVLISHPEFNRIFREFYIRELVANHILPMEEGFAFLQELIDLCAALPQE